MEFQKLIEQCRTTRFYDGTEVNVKDVESAIANMRFGQIIKNGQMLRYGLVTDKELMLDIFRTTNLVGAHKVPEDKAPAGFIVFMQTKEMPAGFAELNIGSQAQLMRLALFDKGIKSGMVHAFDKNKVKDIMKSEFNIVTLVAFGNSDEVIKMRNIDDGEADNYSVDDKGVRDLPKVKGDQLIIVKK